VYGRAAEGSRPEQCVHGLIVGEVVQADDPRGPQRRGAARRGVRVPSREEG
jgi:hypothetical protein